MKSSIAVLVLALCACATAGGGGGDDDTGDDDSTPDARPPDASEILPTDAAEPDAGPMAVTLSQNTSTTVTPDNSIACGASGATSENRYYRVFPLDQLGVTGQFTATSVVFGIEAATAHTVDVKLHTLNGAMSLDNLTQLHTQQVSVPAVTEAPQNQTVTLTTPIVAPAGSQLVVEIASIPPSGGRFFMGSNAAGEAATGWTYAPSCGDTDVITMAAAGAPNMHIVLTVSGTTP